MDFIQDNNSGRPNSPYLFVLKEGKTIQKDYLDYSLMMLQLTLVEHIPSPGHRVRRHPLFPSPGNERDLGQAMRAQLAEIDS